MNWKITKSEIELWDFKIHKKVLNALTLQLQHEPNWVSNYQAAYIHAYIHIISVVATLLLASGSKFICITYGIVYILAHIPTSAALTAQTGKTHSILLSCCRVLINDQLNEFVVTLVQ